MGEPQTWCDQIVDIMAATEPEVDDHCGLLNMMDDAKPFMTNSVKELMRSVFPEARLKKEASFTPYRVGAFMGHKWAFIRDFGRVTKPSKHLPRILNPKLKDFEKKVVEQLEGLESKAEEWRMAIKDAIGKSLAIVLEQDQRDVRQFFDGFTRALDTGTLTRTGKPIAMNPTTQLCLAILFLGPSLDTRFHSSKEFHDFVTKAYGQNVAGHLGRFQKFCQRIQLSFKGPGRPEKNSDTSKKSAS